MNNVKKHNKTDITVKAAINSSDTITHVTISGMLPKTTVMKCTKPSKTSFLFNNTIPRPNSAKEKVIIKNGLRIIVQAVSRYILGVL